MKLIGINKIYQNKENIVHALKDVNLEFNHTGLTVILGPSGCGKTTLLNIMGGVDKDFEGERVEVCEMSYLTQDAQLFESMTVYENLRIVKYDKELVDTYLKKYNLWTHRNKKVKKCSSGQKKRVQFLCALLQSPTMLLCDEPTAALDHENKKILMQDLKEASRNIQVIVVTHDIALAEEYADRIIHMGNGFVKKDEIIHATDGIEEKGKRCKKSFKDTIRLLWYELQSRSIENLLFVLVLILGITSIFTTADLFTTIDNQTSTLDIYKSGGNIVYSYPLNPRRQPIPNSNNEEDLYVQSDFYFHNEILEMIETYPEIIAVEAFYDSDKYFNLGAENNFITKFEAEKKSFKEIEWPIFVEKYKEINQIEMMPPNDPYYPAFFITDNLREKLDEYVESKRKTHSLGGVYIDPVELVDEYGLSFFDLIDENHIPIIYGTMAKETNEIVIAKDVAEFLLKQNGYACYEDMINETITVGVYARDSYEFDWSMDIYNYYYEDEAAYFCNQIDLVITGITNIENDYLNMVFFNSGFGNNEIMNTYVKDYDYLIYEYVRFILDPSVDVEMFMDKINQEFDYPNNDFFSYEGGISSKQIYRNKMNVFIFGCSMIGVFFISLFVYSLFTRKRRNKEQRIMEEYQYSSMVEKIGRVAMLHVLALVIIVVFGNTLVDNLNVLGKDLFYEKILSFNYVFIVTAFVVVLLFNLTCEFLTSKKR